MCFWGGHKASPQFTAYTTCCTMSENILDCFHSEIKHKIIAILTNNFKKLAKFQEPWEKNPIILLPLDLLCSSHHCNQQLTKMHSARSALYIHHLLPWPGESPSCYIASLLFCGTKKLCSTRVLAGKVFALFGASEKDWTQRQV